MVFINQKAFNDDLGRYLHDIKKDKSSTVLSKLKFLRGSLNEKVPELSDNEVHVEYKEPSILRRIIRWRRKLKLRETEAEMNEHEKAEVEALEGEIEALEDEESALEEMEEEFEEKKEGLLSLLMQKLNIFSRKHEEFSEDDFEDEPSQVQEFDEDVKEVLKIAHGWFEKLPARHKKTFKESDDFKKYKDILLKYELVKKK